MSSPTVTVEVAFATDPAATTPIWTDVTAYAYDVQIKRGRQFELDQIAPGTCRVTLDNSDRRFDPTYAGTATPGSSTSAPSTVVDDASIGTDTWANPGNATASDNVYAQVSVGGFSHYLKATGFGFAIPSLATITGIQVSVERQGTANVHKNDHSLRLVKGGTIGGTDKADKVTQWPAADGVATYGSSTDLWGQTWTPADINSANFGVALSADFQVTVAGNLKVDQITVTISYTTSTGPYYPYVLPMRRLRVSAVFSAVTYRVFTGYVERWPIMWQAPDYSEVAITATDGFLPLQQAQLVVARGAEQSGVRVGAVLDAVGWPAADRVIDAGQSTIAASTFVATDNQTALQHLQDVATAENGLFLIDGQGRAVFQDRHRRLTAASSVTFTDSGTTDATHLWYRDLAPSYDADHLYNEVNVTRTGG